MVPTYSKQCRPPALPALSKPRIIMWLDADIGCKTRLREDLLEAAAATFCGNPVDRPRHAILYGTEQLASSITMFTPKLRARRCDRLIDFPILNSGAVAIHRSHPIWEEWRKALLKTINTVVLLHSEQAALNHAAYLSPGLARPLMLPAAANWVCAQALPKWDPRCKNVEPDFSWPIETSDRIKAEQRNTEIGGGEVLTELRAPPF